MSSQIRFLAAWNRAVRRRMALLSLLLTAWSGAIHAAEEPLVMGVFPRFSASESTVRYSQIAEYVGEQIGRKVVLATPRDFPSFWQGVVDQRYDVVQYNQLHFVRSSKT
jgi:phosphonate transport system substrate-binding protein